MSAWTGLRELVEMACRCGRGQRAQATRQDAHQTAPEPDRARERRRRERVTTPAAAAGARRASFDRRMATQPPPNRRRRSYRSDALLRNALSCSRWHCLSVCPPPLDWFVGHGRRLLLLLLAGFCRQTILGVHLGRLLAKPSDNAWRCSQFTFSDLARRVSGCHSKGPRNSSSIYICMTLCR